MSLIHNERVKLTATYLNGVAIAIFAVGGLAPVVSILNAASPSTSPGTAAISLICIAGSVALHFNTRYFLKGLRS